MRKPIDLVALLAAGAVLRLPTFGRPLLSDDEAIYASTADAMMRGAVLYRDVVDHKPPLIYFIYRAGFELFGAFQTAGAHLAVVLAVLATAVALVKIGARLPEGRKNGLTAAGLFLVFSTTWHDYDALAANCELFLLVPTAWAALLALGSVAAERGRGAFVAQQIAIGALVGLAALCKYQGITFLGASVGLLIWGWLRGQVGSARVLGGPLLQLLGVSLPLLVYGLWAWRAGGWEASLEWFRFNFLYVGAGLGGLEALRRGVARLGMIGSMALPVYGLGLLEVARLVRRVRQLAMEEVLALLWLGTAAIGVCAGGRFFGHYFHLTLPALALLAAPGWLRLWRRSAAARTALVAATALPALLWFAFATVARPWHAALDASEPDYDRVADRVASVTQPDERIFVWGNSPQLYVLARRSMGTRFSFCNYMTGESPGTPTETGARDASANSHAPAWEMLFADLDRRRPALFVDTASAGWDGYDKFPIARYPRLAAYLSHNYRLVDIVDGVAIYRRFP